MKTLKEILFWDYSDIENDIFYKSEVQANKIVAVTMFNSAIILLFCLLLNQLGVLALGDSFIWIALEGSLELFIPAILCFVFKGRKKWLKFVLLIELTIVAARMDSCLTFYVVIFALIPIILSTRYSSKKFTSMIGAISILLMIVSAFMWYFTQATVNYNLYSITELRALPDTFVDAETFRNVVSYWDYTLFELEYDTLPKTLLYLIVAYICVKGASKNREMIEEQTHIASSASRLEAELSTATYIQANMLPSIFPVFPEYSEFDIYATMHPAKEVGGDFYDFFMIDEKRLGFVIADVSGKGVPAALFMVITKTLIKNYAMNGSRPNDVFMETNNSLCEGNSAGLFVTAWFGVLNLENGRLIYCNAGHNPPLICHEGKYSYLKCKHGFVLAGMENVRYKTEEIQLTPGDKMFLYTDGVTEGTNLSDELYGEERLANCLNSKIETNVYETIDRVKADMDIFVGKAEQFDDITMVSLDFKKYKSEDNVISKEFDADINQLEFALDFVEETITSLFGQTKTIIPIRVAIEEVFVNVCHYAYEGKGKVELGVSITGNKVKIRIIDNGKPFNPLEKVDPDTSLAVEERDIGGLGIFMVKKTMDDIKYEYVDDKNILTLITTLK